MARPVAKTSTDSTWSDIPALLMLGSGMLLYLALISYVPSDLPAWVPFSPGATPNSPAQNFIGPVGAVIAGLNYFLLGVASFLVAALLLLFGAAKLFFPALELRSRLGWMFLFVLSGTCLAQLQPWFLHGWRAEFNAHGPGGIVGVWLGVRVLRHLLGQAGSAIMLLLAYGCALILMTGLHPVVQARKVAHFLYRKGKAWREQQAALRLARASQQELLDLERRSLAKEQRKLEKQLRPQGHRSAAHARKYRRRRRSSHERRPHPRRVCQPAFAQVHGQLGVSGRPGRAGQKAELVRAAREQQSRQDGRRG